MGCLQTYSLPFIVSLVPKELCALPKPHKGKKRIKKAVVKMTTALVENIGVEPMTSCMPCKRSSQLS